MSNDPSGKREPCAGLGEMLSAYLDNELDSDARRAVEEHIEDCMRCSAELSELRQVKRFVASTSPFAPSLPEGIAQRVRARTYAGTISDKRHRPSPIVHRPLHNLFVRSRFRVRALGV